MKKTEQEQRARLIQQIKITGGMTAKDLAQHLGLSYMGAKRHCLYLTDKGYLCTWRQPGELGRPQLLYRLTPKGEKYFQTAATELSLGILRSIETVCGSDKVRPVLESYYFTEAKKKQAEWASVDFTKKMQLLARYRETQGYIVSYQQNPYAIQEWELVEHHSPTHGLSSIWPYIEDIERQVLELVMGAEVTRTPRGEDSHKQSVYRIRERLPHSPQ